MISRNEIARELGRLKMLETSAHSCPNGERKTGEETNKGEKKEKEREREKTGLQEELKNKLYVG